MSNVEFGGAMDYFSVNNCPIKYMLITLCQEGKLAELTEKSSELSMKNRLLGERNQQIHSLEKDLAIKEETIQKLRVQLDEAHLSADQVCYPLAIGTGLVWAIT